MEVVTQNNEDYYTGRISEVEYTVGNDIIRYVYSYDDYSNIIEINGYTNNILTYYEENYYDAFNQVVAQEIIINGKDIISEYGYDANGNIVSFYSYDRTNSVSLHPGYFSYNYNNEITSYTLDGRTYNTNYVNGLLMNYKSNNIFYDYDRIVEIDGPDDYIYYSYNANGIRISKNVSGIMTNYVLNGNNIIRETKGNNVINYYYDSNNDVIGFTYNNQKYLYLKNLQNDVIGIIDSSGDIVVKYYYDAYGNIISTTDISGINLSSINPFRYRSYYYDNETGWYYLNSRYYDPLIKRFITPDDINYLGASGSAISYNLYSYCENNPINSLDANGNWLDRLVCGVVAAAAFALLAYIVCRIFEFDKKTTTIVTLAFAALGGIIGAALGPSFLARYAPNLLKALKQIEHTKFSLKAIGPNKGGNIFGIVISNTLIIMLHAPHPKYNEWFFHLQIEVNIAGFQIPIFKYPLLYVNPAKWGKK